MAAEQSGAFADNWAYLKAELNWLERVLMVAVARQRKEVREVERVAQSRSDRVSSHWWKGVISTEGQGIPDEHRKPDTSQPRVNYHQQIEKRIQASREQGVVLGLPLLRDRLQLTLFEKNLVLLSLAPEVNRRYAGLYRYLQGEEGNPQSSLPTVDLALRLLCRDDKEWRMARSRLFSGSPLVDRNLLHLLPRPFDASLNHYLRLSAAAVDYLLAETPTDTLLESLLSVAPSSVGLGSLLATETQPVDWSELRLPAPLMVGLRSLTHALSSPPGRVVLLAGPQGTGKTMASRAIAHSLQTALVILDLNTVYPEDYTHLLRHLEDRNPPILLIQSAEHWLRRTSSLSPPALHHFLATRRRTASLTCFSVSQPTAVALRWQSQLDETLIFPVPSLGDRQSLWQQAIPPNIPIASDINWAGVSRRPLTGGEIRAIAQTALSLQQADGQTELTLAHLRQAFMQHGKSLGKGGGRKEEGGRMREEG